MPKDAGKCFARAVISDQFSIQYDTIGVYDIDEEIPHDKLIYSYEVPKTTKWVKKKADKNCLSRNPEDCLVWCLQEEGGYVEERMAKTVVDTSGTTSRQYVVKEDKVVTEEGGFTEWVEVLCQKDITEELIFNIRTSLIARGYELESDINGQDYKVALKNFQSDNQLPLGQLDVFTMEALGVL